MADAVVRVFIDHGDRTNRTKARLKYVLDALRHREIPRRWSRRSSGASSSRVPAEALAPRPGLRPLRPYRRASAEAGGLNWIGVVLAGRQAHGGADARPCRRSRASFGDGDIRLTVWQNLLISGVPTARVAAAEAAIEALGLAPRRSSLRAGLVACTGNIGCKFAASDTKRHAEEIATGARRGSRSTRPSIFISPAAIIPAPSTIIGDIGLLACKVQETEDGEQIEGYHVLVGGGFGPDAALGREVYRDVKATDAPRPSNVSSRPISRTAPRRRKPSWPSPPPRHRRAQGAIRARGAVS